MTAKVLRCSRCNRRQRGPDAWNVLFRMGVVVGYLCPYCQTPAENAEAEINEATVDYSSLVIDAEGRFRARAVGD